MTNQASKICLLLWVILFTSGCDKKNDTASVSLSENLVGKWKDKYGQGTVFIFNSDKTATMIMGGEELIIDSWVLDENHDPMHLDLTKTAFGKSTTLIGIASFIHKNELNIKVGFNGQRPKGFFGKDRIILERQ
ncbi:MAG: hypothetical protein P8O06_07135 [Porticoccaceae bacterium]|nr:hypothetical protein [Porticoccaceae bacterium]